jgi:hypothetical protein
VFSCVFFYSDDSGAAMTTSGPPAASTPGIGLVKFGLFAVDSIVKVLGFGEGMGFVSVI